MRIIRNGGKKIKKPTIKAFIIFFAFCLLVLSHSTAFASLSTYTRTPSGSSLTDPVNIHISGTYTQTVGSYFIEMIGGISSENSGCIVPSISDFDYTFVAPHIDNYSSITLNMFTDSGCLIPDYSPDDVYVLESGSPSFSIVSGTPTYAWITSSCDTGVSIVICEYNGAFFSSIVLASALLIFFLVLVLAYNFLRLTK